MFNWRAFLLILALSGFVELYLEGASRFRFGDEIWFRVAILAGMVVAGALWQYRSVRESRFWRAAAQTLILWIPAVVGIVVNAFTLHRGLAKDTPSNFVNWISTFFIWLVVMAVPMSVFSSLASIILRFILRQSKAPHLA